MAISTESILVSVMFCLMYISPARCQVEHLIISTRVGYHIFGAIQQPNITDVEPCIRSCHVTLGCLAVDYDVKGPSCWFHFMQTGCRRLYPKKDITHYTLVECMTRRQQLGGALQADIINQTECIQACRGSTSCVVADYDVETDQCWFHDEVTACGIPPTRHANVNNFRLTNCSGTAGPRVLEVISTSAGFHAVGGQKQSSGLPALDCLNGCRAKAGCRAVDYDASDGECWYHYDNTNCLDLFPCRSCTHYKLVACDKGYHVVGGHNRTEMASVRSCIDACVQNPACVGVDFNTIDGGCWHHGRATVCNQGRVMPGTDHYRLASCENIPPNTTPWLTQSTPPLPTTATRTQLTTATTSVVYVETTTEPHYLPDLMASYRLFINSNSPYGTLHRDVITFDGCMTRCESTPSCQAFDFNNNDQTCFLHDHGTSCSSVNPKPACVHVKITTCKQIQQVDSAEVYRTAERPGGVLQTGATSFVACLFFCYATIGCQAFDFDFVDSSCHLHSAVTSCGRLVGKLNSVHVRLVVCQVTTTTTSTTTTPPLFIGKPPTIYSSSYIRHGQIQRGISTFEACFNLCQADSDCPSFDYNFNMDHCFFHGNRTACQPLGVKPACVHIEINECTYGKDDDEEEEDYDTKDALSYTDDIRTILANAYLPGGAHQQAFTTFQGCYSACDAFHLCRSFNYNFLKNECHFHFPNTACDKPQRMPSSVYAEKPICTIDE